MPGRFLHNLFHCDECEVDSLIVSGVVSIFALVCFTGFQLYQDHAAFNPMTFGGATATIISALAGGHWMRDGRTEPKEDK